MARLFGGRCVGSRHIAGGRIGSIFADGRVFRTPLGRLGHIRCGLLRTEPAQLERLWLALGGLDVDEGDLANRGPELVFLLVVLAQASDDAVDVAHRYDLAGDPHKRARDTARVAPQVRRKRGDERRGKKVDVVALLFGELSSHKEGPFDKSSTE